MLTTSSHLQSTTLSREILNITRTAYPGIVLLVFLVGFTTYGIVTSASDGTDTVQVGTMLGPGGRPLPQRRKSANQLKEAAAVNDFSPNTKLVFKLISAGVILTFVVLGVSVILQTILYRQSRWWPGQGAVVGSSLEKTRGRN